ncbi:MAG: ATP-binding protein [Gallionella sp.]|nr:ATP-binding protein [Gallionella sp.]MDD4960001.1 ATP-binding protein [Gallionella sp.]
MLQDTPSDLSLTTPPNDFRLLRLILIDSLSAGKVVELPLEGGAVLTGRNGRGKTSMLQLLPLFYGESANRIVTKEGNKKSFFDYYLPNATSYIVFEYQRPAEQKRLVVIYSDPSAEQLRYRFVRHGFDLKKQFVTISGELVESANLVKHLKMEGYQCSELQISTLAEYRAIIQGVASGTRDRDRQKQLSNLTRDYACTPISKPLGQIEKIVSGMFKRKTNFEDLQSMVVDCISEQEGSVSLSGDRSKIEDWPRHYRAYRDVMALAPTMEAADEVDQQWQAAEQVLGGIRAQYQSLQLHFEATYQNVATEQRSLKEQANQASDAHHAKRGSLFELQGEAHNNVEFFDKKARSLQQQHDEYERNGMAQKAEQVAREAQFKNDFESSQKRKAALLGEQADISNRYNELKQNERDIFSNLRDELQARRTEIATENETAVQGLENDFQRIEKDFAVKNTATRQPLQKAVEDAHADYGRCEYIAKNALPDPAITARWEEKREQLDKARKEKDEQIQQQTALNAAYRKAKQAFEEQERHVSTAQVAVEKAQASLAEIQKFYAPEVGTLLHYLRHEHPDWTLDIAKVIRHDIFDRKDLTPSVLENNASLYGLRLNLDKLEAHPLANQQDALREIGEAETRLKDAQAKLKAEEDKLLKLDNERKAADAARLAQDQQVQRAQSRVQQIEKEVQEAKRQVEHSKNQARVQAEQAKEAAKQQLETQKQALKQLDAEIKLAAEKRQQSYQVSRKNLLAQRDADLRNLDEQQKTAQNNLDAKLREYDQERDAALQQNGVDTVRLNRIEGEINALNKTLAMIRQDREAVSRWQNWCENDWPSHAQYLKAAEQHRDEEQQHKLEIQRLDSEWKKSQQDFNHEIARLTKQLSTLEVQQKSVQKHLDGLLAYPAQPTPVYDPTWTLDSLTERTNEQLKQVAQLEKTIKEHITALTKPFNQHTNTAPFDYLQNHRHDLAVSPDRSWLPLFKHWFGEEHLQYQRILLTEAKTIAGSIVSFHQEMNTFHRKVQQFNRELQSNLDTSMLFESITHVSVEVVSTIKELKYWDAIREMAEANRTWLDGLSNELPPNEFADTLGRLLAHWDVKAGIRADLKSLIQIRGEVTENGNLRRFRKALDLEAVSSNGLSYLVLVIIFVGFINRIRRQAPVNIVWALDELKDLDSGNVPALLELLRRNNITLVSAFPDPDPETLALFQHRFTVEPDRRLAEVRIDLTGELDHV